MADRPYVLSIIAESVTIHHKKGYRRGKWHLTNATLWKEHLENEK